MTAVLSLSLAERTVLAILSERPVHGFAIARLTEPEGELGRIWQIPRPVIYRSITRLLDAGLLTQDGVEACRGPQRTRYAVTPEGRRLAASGWTPPSSTSGTSARTCCSSWPCSTGRAVIRRTCSAASVPP